MERSDKTTTREAACLLQCQPSEALPLLRAARIPYERIGSAYLWDSAAIVSLLRSLQDFREPMRGGGTR